MKWVMILKNQQVHQFPAYYNSDSEILILGSFPSVVSRKSSFYYMHPQNRFWKLLALIFDDGFETSDIDEKKNLLNKHKIALYDVIEQCNISGSSDSSIEDVVPSNIEEIMNSSKIERIFLNGNLARDLFQKHQKKLVSLGYALPSTSSANARYSIEKLFDEWKVIKI